MSKSKRLLSVIMVVLLIANIFATGVSAAETTEVDEASYQAQYGIETSAKTVHPGDEIDVYLKLSTNYIVYSAQAAVLYDSSLFEIVVPDGKPSSTPDYIDNSGDFENYKLLGSASSPSMLYKRNSNPTKWAALSDSVKVAYVGFAGDSSKGVPVAPNGTVAKFTLKVKEDAKFGSKGTIYMDSDWIKTADCPAGLTFVARSCTEAFSNVSGSYVAHGQTIDLTEATTEITVGHTFKEEVIKPTCTSEGYTLTTCTKCNYESKSDYTNKVDHKYVDKVTPPTCTEKGYTTHTCSVCLGSYVDTYVDANGHNFKTLIKSEAATCTKDGYELYQCTACDKTNEVTLKATGHETTKTEANAETCTKDGNIAYWTCKNCKKLYSDEACKTEIELKDTVISAKKHNYKDEVTAPTCEEQGYTTHTCSNCGDTFVDTYVNATGHKAGKVVVVDATATKDGSKTTYCANCDKVLSVETIKKATGKVVVTAVSNGRTVLTGVVNGDYSATVTVPKGSVIDVGEVSAAISMTDVASLGVNGTKTYERTLATGIEKKVELDNYLPSFNSATVSGMIDGKAYSYSFSGTDTAEAFSISATPADKDAAATAWAALTSHMATSEQSADDSYAIVPGAAYIQIGTEKLTFEDVNSSLKLDNIVAGSGITSEIRTAVKLENVAELDDAQIKMFIPAGTVLALGQTVVTLEDDATIRIYGYKDSADVNNIMSALRDCTTSEEIIKTAVLFISDAALAIDGRSITMNVEFDHIAEDEWTIIDKATCTEDGLKVKYCIMCGEIAEEEVIPATDHAYNDVVTDPTCTKQGYTTHTCSNCGDTFVDTYVKENGHNFKTLIKSEAATCTKDGYEIYQCTACDETNEVTLEAPGHKPVKTEAVEATCENGGNVEYWTCSVCKKTFADEACTKVITSTSTTAKGHNGKKTEAKDPTCTEDGNIEYWTCERCKKIFSDEACKNEIKSSDTVIPAKHSLTKTDAKDVTCTVDGNIAYWTCGKCEKLFSDEAGTKEITLDDTVIKSTGHDWGEWKTTTEPTASTDGEETRKCNNCDETQSRTASKLDLSLDRADMTVNGKTIKLTSYANANNIAIRTTTLSGESVQIEQSGTKISKTKDGNRYTLSYTDWKAAGEQTETTVKIGEQTYVLTFEFTTAELTAKDVQFAEKGMYVEVDNENKIITVNTPVLSEKVTLKDKSDSRKTFQYKLTEDGEVTYNKSAGAYTITLDGDGTSEKQVTVNDGRYCEAEYTLRICVDAFDPTSELKLIRSTAEYDAESRTITLNMRNRENPSENAIGVYNVTKSGYAVEITNENGIAFENRSDAYVAYDLKNGSATTETLKITLSNGKVREYNVVFAFTAKQTEINPLKELKLIRTTAEYDSESRTITLNMRERENPKENAIGVYNVTKSGYAVEITNENGIAFENRSDAYVAYDLKNGSAKTETLTIKLSDGTEQKYKVVFAFTEKEEESKFDPIPELKLIRANASMQEDENGEYILIAKKAGKNAAGVYVDTNSGYTCSITSNNTVFDSSRTDAFVAYTSANESRTEETITFTFGDGTTKEYRIVFELA